MPSRSAIAVCPSTRPGPPPQASTVSPPQNLTDLEGLAAVDRREAQALAAQPQHGVEGAGHELLAELRIGAVARHPKHVVEELLGRVGAEIGAPDLLVGEVRHQRAEILGAA